MNNNIQELYCSFEVSKLLKEKGFDVPCILCHADGDDKPLPFNIGSEKHINSKHPYYSAPTHALAIEWIMVNFGIVISTRHLPFNQKFGYEITGKYEKETRGYIKPYNLIHYNSPQEAISEALLYTLKNLI